MSTIAIEVCEPHDNRCGGPVYSTRQLFAIGIWMSYMRRQDVHGILTDQSMAQAVLPCVC